MKHIVYLVFVVAWLMGVVLAKGFWLTAAHCVEGDTPLWIGDAPAYRTDATDIVGAGDMAIVFSPTASAPVDLKLAKFPPKHGDVIRVVGFPAGVGPILTQGFVGSPLVFLHYYGEWLMSLDVSICGGNSGSAVLNSKGEVISVLTRYHYPRPPCMALAGGPPWAQLVSFAHEYFRR